MDVASAAGDPDVPLLNWMYESLFGEDGKLQIYWVAVDEQTIVFGVADKEQVAASVTRLQEEEFGLSKSKTLAPTKALLAVERSGEIYISPHGCAQWANRVAAEFFGPLIGQEQEAIELPASPPVGISLDFPPGQYSVELVWPAEATEALLKAEAELAPVAR